MLTSETKRRIDACRDVLVGKLPPLTDQMEMIMQRVRFANCEPVVKDFILAVIALGRHEAKEFA